MNTTETVWDKLIEWVPPSLHTAYWQGVAKAKRIDPQDDLVSLLIVMGIQTFIVRQVPELVASERAALEKGMAQMREEFLQNQQSCRTQLDTCNLRWMTAVDDVQSYLQDFETVANRLEAVSAEAAKKILPLEKVASRVEEILNLFERSISQAEKARESQRLILMRWTYINAGTTAIVILLLILSLTLR